MRSARHTFFPFRHSTFVLLSSLALLTSSLSCANYPHPTLDGLTPADAQSLAISAVRQFEQDPSLPLQVFDTLPTPAGNYAVSLQRKTSATTADHWRVIVHPDRSTEVLPADVFPSTPDTLHAYPTPLQNAPRQTQPPPPEPIQIIPNPAPQQ